MQENGMAWMEREPTGQAEQALVRHQALILLHLFVSIPHMLPSSCGTVCLHAGDRDREC